MNLELQDVHVLVTGASGGIGLATAALFLQVGARVTAHFNSNQSTLEPLISRYGPSHIRTAQADLTGEESVIEMFNQTSAEFGPVQVLVINHAVYPREIVPVAHMSLEQWSTTMNTNLTSSFLVVREYLRRLEEASDSAKSKASVVLVGSAAGKYGSLGHADYAANKSAMMYGLMLSLKNEIVRIAPRGRVNCIAPGPTRTSMLSHVVGDQERMYRMLATNPLRKMGSPEDVATQIVSLSSSTVSGHVTGQVLMVDGGMEGFLQNKPEDIVV